MIHLYVAASLDGYIADRDGGIGWLDPFDNPDTRESYEEMIEGVTAIVTGRVTYEQMLEFGPWRYDKQQTLIVSSRVLPDLPPNTEVVAIDALQEELTRLRKAHDNIWLMGGGQTTRALLDRGELDEIKVYVIPVLLGGGLPLFPGGGAFDELRLLETKTLDGGIVMLRYDARGR